MSDSTPVSFPVNPHDDRPLPLIVAERWNFPLQHQLVDGQWRYAILDWIAGLTTASAELASKNWNDIQRGEGFDQTSVSTRSLDYVASDGKTYQRDFTNDKGLYFIAQHLRTTHKRPMLKEIKLYLAESGAFADLARRDPEGVAARLHQYADDKDIRKMIDEEGFTPEQAKEWKEQRIRVTESRKTIAAIWYRRKATSWDFGALTNQIDRMVHGKSATQRKREMNLPKHDTPRNYDAAADLAMTVLTETMAGMLHEWRDSEGYKELSEDIEDTHPFVNDARPSVHAAFSKKRRRLPGENKPQLPE